MCFLSTYDHYYFAVDAAAQCTPTKCSGRFSGCPDAGAHNELGHLAARYDLPVEPSPSPNQDKDNDDGIAWMVLLVVVPFLIGAGIMLYRKSGVPFEYILGIVLIVGTKCRPSLIKHLPHITPVTSAIHCENLYWPSS